MVKHTKKQENKQTIGGSDNKILRILVYLKKQGKDGDSRPQIEKNALTKGASDDQMKKLLDKTNSFEWTKSEVVTAGKQQTTVYYITPEGKKALEEIQNLVSKSIYLSKLDAFDEVFETKHQKSFEN